MIRHLFRWIKKEFLHIFPVFVYFLIMFNLLNFTESFLLRRAGVPPFTFLQILIAAGIIAKVVLVVDHLPLIHLLRRKPLIYVTLWKTFIYWFIVFCVRLGIRFIPFLHQPLPHALDSFVDHTNWKFFATIQAWYFILFFLFVISRELIEVIGRDKVRKIFFGVKK
ncbi:MAG: hypothetical protein KGJ02_07405 [Verrucomicrobiota bacterium]|nr:hypothetical protein [Verrucomicrobiota bacterium]